MNFTMRLLPLARRQPNAQPSIQMEQMLPVRRAQPVTLNWAKDSQGQLYVYHHVPLTRVFV